MWQDKNKLNGLTSHSRTKRKEPVRTTSYLKDTKSDKFQIVKSIGSHKTTGDNVENKANKKTFNKVNKSLVDNVTKTTGGNVKQTSASLVKQTSINSNSKQISGSNVKLTSARVRHEDISANIVRPKSVITNQNNVTKYKATKDTVNYVPSIVLDLLGNKKPLGKGDKLTPMSQDGSVERYPAWEEIQTEAGRNTSDPGFVLQDNDPLDYFSEHQTTGKLADDANNQVVIDVTQYESEEKEDDDDEDDGWDTDLEDDRYTRHSVTHDERARVVYLAACKKFRVTPSSSYLKSLKTGVANLNNQGLGPIGTKAIALSLVTNDTVKELRIAGNSIGRTGIKYLMDMIYENDIITHLDISDNDLQSYGAEMICDTLEEDDIIVSLKLSGNKFKESDAEFFLRILSFHKSALKELDLSHNEFAEEGGKILGKALSINDTLEILNLSWNQLRYEGMVPVAEALKENSRLTHLDLSWNGIEDKGADVLAEAAKDNETLQYLNLIANRIGPDGMAHLLQKFCENKKLKVLKICNNPITFEGPVIALEIINSYPDCSLELLEFKDMCVPKAFYNLLQTVNGSKPKFKVNHGGYANGFDSFQDAIQRREENTMNDPFMYLINYVNEHKLKWVELFNRMDTDRNFSISREEFSNGIQKAGIPMKATQLDLLIDRLDTNNDGEVDLGELLAGHKKYLKRMEKVLGQSPKPVSADVNKERQENKEIISNANENKDHSNAEENDMDDPINIIDVNIEIPIEQAD